MAARQNLVSNVLCCIPRPSHRMRDHAVKLAVFVMLCLTVPGAYARPHRSDAQPARKPAAKTETRSTRRSHHTVPRAGEPEARREQVREVAGKGKHAGRASHAVKPLPTGRTRNLREAAEPAAPAEAHEPEIHVTHDRKVHLRPGVPDDPEAAGPVSERKATGSDFLAPVPKPVRVVLDKPAEKLAPAPVVKARLPRQPVPVAAEAPDPVPVIIPALFTRNGRLIVPPAMKGSHEILVHQNEMADREGLVRVQDDQDLERMRGERLLVAIPTGVGVSVDDRLPLNRRYCRPWTAQFLAALGRAHFARFHTPLQVNSAVRTVEFQARLQLTNGNAAPAEGLTASPHLTGQAVDIAKHGLSVTEIAWLRGYLLPLVQQGKVDVEEEFQQSCFHISVYRQYAPQEVPKRVIARRHGDPEVLAAAIP